MAGAFAAASLPRGPVAAACLGLAGAGRPADQAVIAAWARAWAARRRRGRDRRHALAARGRHAGRLGRRAGRRHRLDGVGARSRRAARPVPAAGVPCWATRAAAMRSSSRPCKPCARAADGRGPTTALLQRFLSQFGLHQPSDLIGAVYRGGLDRTALGGAGPGRIRDGRRRRCCRVRPHRSRGRAVGSDRRRRGASTRSAHRSATPSAGWRLTSFRDGLCGPCSDCFGLRTACASSRSHRCATRPKEPCGSRSANLNRDNLVNLSSDR